MKITPIQVTIADLTKIIKMMEMVAYSVMMASYDPSIVPA